MAISIHSVFDITAITVGILAYVKCGKRLNIKERPIKYNLLIIAAIRLVAAYLRDLQYSLMAFLRSQFISTACTGEIGNSRFSWAIAGTKIIKLFTLINIFFIDQAIGDQVIIPFSIAQIIGRIGCFLSVLLTTPWKTNRWPWDMIMVMHFTPSDAAFVFFVAVSCAGILFFWKRLDRYGLRFQLFVFAYCFQRFIIEFTAYIQHPIMA